MKLLILACLIMYARAEFKIGCTDECCQYISMEGIKVAECSYNELDEVPQHVSPETQILDIRGNEIKHIPADYFDKFPNLVKLNINYNDLEELSPGLFDKLTKLEYLDMHENEIKEIPADLFKNNKKLKTLRMMELLIKTLPTGLFDDLNELETLKLEGNSDKLKCGCDLVKRNNLKCTRFSVSTCTFKAKKSVIEPVPESYRCPKECKCYKQNGDIVASCSHRGLTKVPSDIPADTNKLYLNHNDIENVDVGTFAHLTQLKLLSLRGNKMTSITDGIFNGLKKLERLYNNYNEITTIGANSFKDLENLEYLDLHGNIISNLDEKAFVGLQGLKTLDLHNNAVVSLPSNIFSPLLGLKYMRWEGNLELVCTCPLVQKFMTMRRPGSYGRCSFNGVEKHIVRWGNDAMFIAGC